MLPSFIVRAMAAVMIVGAATAQVCPLQVTEYSSESALDATTPNLAYAALGRVGYGTNSDGQFCCTPDIVLGDTVADLSTNSGGLFQWFNSANQAFRLRYNENSSFASLSAGSAPSGAGPITSRLVSDPGDLLSIRVRSTDHSTIRIQDLVVDGCPVPGSIVASGPGAFEGLLIEGFHAADGFEMTGRVTFSWSNGPAPLGDQLGFEIRVASSFGQSDIGERSCDARFVFACQNCPCGNDLPQPTFRKGGCINSAGTPARLFAAGEPSVAEDSLRFGMTGVVPNSFAMLASAVNLLPHTGDFPCGPGAGITGIGIDGMRCIGGDFQRHGIRPSNDEGLVGMDGVAGWGGLDGPVGGLLNQLSAQVGQTRHFQVFYRDDVALSCMQGANTSDARSLVFVP